MVSDVKETSIAKVLLHKGYQIVAREFNAKSMYVVHAPWVYIVECKITTVTVISRCFIYLDVLCAKLHCVLYHTSYNTTLVLVCCQTWEESR